MRRTLTFLAASLVVIACANPAELADLPDVGVIEAGGNDASLKDAGADAKKDSGGSDATVVDAQGDAPADSTIADSGVDGSLDAMTDAAGDADDGSVDASDGGLDASDGGLDASDGGIVVIDGGTNNDTCPNAIALTSGVSISGDTTTANDDYDVNDVNLSLVCSNTELSQYAFDGKDVVFTIAVPTGKTLTAVVTPIGNWDPALVLSTDCNNLDSTCVGGDDLGAEGDPETGTYTNTTNQTVTVFVIVDSYDFSEYGAFTLSNTVQ